MPYPEDNSHLLLPGRRSFLAKSAVAVTGLVASTSVSSAFLFRKERPLDLSFLPRDWVRQEGERSVQSYGSYLKSLRLKFVTPEQVLKAHAKRKGSLWNSLPERNTWRAMANSLKVADRIGATLGMPVAEVTSAYRSPSYNRRCPGAGSNSWHMRNYALDLKFKTSPGAVASVARRIRKSGYFKGGVGRYSTFTHIDTRGQNVDW
ncbi:MAG: D-Ala-D-Ala carboxypeptidase family metallohydrolase [Verrucomicrobiaceae bacterium]